MKSWGDTVLGDAEQLLREGRILEARPLLVSYVQKDPSSARGWWLLSMALSEPKQQIDCLERVLRLDPNNAAARTRLSKLKGETPPRPKPVSFETSPPVRQAAPQPAPAFVPFLPEEEAIPEPPRAAAPKPLPVKKKTDWVLPVSILAVCLCIAVGIVGTVLVLRARQQAAPAPNAQPTQTLPVGLPPTWTPTITFTPGPSRTPIPGLSSPDPGITQTATDIPSSNLGIPPGKDAPDFTLTNVGNGQQTSLSDFRGHPVVIFFFLASASCNYCAFEAPALQQAYVDYQNAGLVVLGIDLSGFGIQSEAAGAENARAFRDTYSLTFPILNGWDASVFRKYKGNGFPLNYFVDSEGKVSSSSFGALDYSSLNIRIRVMLNLIPTKAP